MQRSTRHGEPVASPGRAEAKGTRATRPQCAMASGRRAETESKDQSLPWQAISREAS